MVTGPDGDRRPEDGPLSKAEAGVYCVRCGNKSSLTLVNGQFECRDRRLCNRFREDSRR